MASNRKLAAAMHVLAQLGEWDEPYREIICTHVDQRIISIDDPWVAAALGCVDDADIPDVALEFFIADVKDGYYDLLPVDPSAVS